MVVTVGIDVHKQTHCAVAVDEVGRQLGESLTVRATDAGHRRLLAWADRSFPEVPVVFAVEDCRQLSGRLERALLTAGCTVVRVPPKLTAQTRASARSRGKSDPIDALAVARAAGREPGLPRAEHTHASRQVKLLVDHRDDLVAERTRMQNRLRWHLHELDPELDPAARGLDRGSELDRIRVRLAELPAEPGPAGTVTETVRRIALELAADISALTVRINALEKELTGLVRVQAPQLLALPGCGVLTAADRGQAGRRDREPDPVRPGGALRHARRRRPDPGVLRKDQPAPARPRRQPATQRRPAPHRRHPDPPRRTRPRLLPTPTSPRRHHDGSPPRPQTTPRPGRIHPPQTHYPSPSLLYGRGLT
jgi:transposase